MLFLLALLSSELLFASDSHWEATVSAVPASLSGTLEPLTVSYEGKIIVRGDSGCTALLVNGKPVAVKTEEHKPFFAQITTDELEMSSVQRDGSAGPTVTKTLPKIRSTQIVVAPSGTRELQLEVSGAAKAMIDQHELKLVSGVATWPLSEQSLSSEPIIELRSDEGMPRTYALKIEEVHPPTATSSNGRMQLGAGMMPSTGGTGFRLGYGSLLSSRIAGAVYLQYSSTTVLNSGSFGAQLGWQVLQRPGIAQDAPWLELGLSAEAGADVTQDSASSDGTISGKFTSFGYLRSDFITVSVFSMGAVAQLPISGRDPGSAWLELNFHF